jgi:hypothetical protein
MGWSSSASFEEEKLSFPEASKKSHGAAENISMMLKTIL